MESTGNIPVKRTYYDHFEFAEFTVKKYISGWLSPQGKFYPCKWGKHTNEIYDILEELGMLEMFWELEDHGFCEGAREWVIKEKGWILLNNPYGDEQTQVVVFNPLMKHNKKQMKAFEKLFETELDVINKVYTMLGGYNE